MAPVAFGATLTSGPGTVFPHVPDGYDHVFAPGVANACLFHSVAVAADPAQREALVARSGRQARRDATAKIKRRLHLEQLHNALLAQETMEGVDNLVSHLINVFPDLTQDLAAVMNIEDEDDRDQAIHELMSDDSIFPDQFDLSGILPEALYFTTQGGGLNVDNELENETAQLLLNDLEEAFGNATQEGVKAIINSLHNSNMNCRFTKYSRMRFFV